MNGTLTYRQARIIVMGFGSALVAAVALTAYFRGADLIEVVAILLFLPILFGLVMWQARGGVLAAIPVSIAYLVLRFSSLSPEIRDEFYGAGFFRVLLYVGLGLFGGWANEMLAQALRKLELYDEVDDATGVGNARALLSVADREVSRADRYRSIFSLVVIHLEQSAFAGLDERHRTRAIRRLCQTVESSVRDTDLVTRVALDGREDVAVVLPETGREGASLLLGRLVVGARELLNEQGASARNGAVSGEVLTYPGDDEAVAEYRRMVGTALGMSTLQVEESPA